MDILQDKTIEGLLASACPSIQYRARRELLDEPAQSRELRALHRQILQDDAVQAVIESRQPDGWLGERFHGYDSLEAGVRLLCEKGIDAQHPVLAGAVGALETQTDRIHREMGTVGVVLDQGGLGGTSMMGATVLAYAGIEDRPLVREQVEVALKGLGAVTGVASMDDVVEPYKTKLVFKPGVRWPGIYHLRLLAFTQSWRTPATQEIVASAVRRLVEWSPLPYVHVRHRSQLIAPASFGMQDFNPDLATMDAAQWMIWFHRMELLARLGVVKEVPELRRQVGALRDLLDAGGGWFTKRLSHSYFRRWGAYTGLMLERDWRAARRRVFDLTFRCLLIGHYSGV